ncbi:MAG: DUF5320 domain-containing protein [Candidatus Aenigmatarchaeota archaeon]
MPWEDGTDPWWAYGRGWRCWRRFSPRVGFPSLTKEEEIEMLKAEKKALEAECLEIEKRLAELK